MDPRHALLLPVMLAVAAGCTSVDASRYRLRHSWPIPPPQRAADGVAGAQDASASGQAFRRIPRIAAPGPKQSAPAVMIPPVVVPPVPTPPAAATPPAPVTACDPGGCWSQGERYQGGTGDTYLDRQGRLCRGGGGWMQCY